MFDNGTTHLARLPTKPEMLVSLLLLAATVLCAEPVTLSTPTGDVKTTYSDSESVSSTASLHETVDFLHTGEFVQIAPGVYSLEKTLRIDVDRITIRGAGSDSTIIRCPEDGSAFIIQSRDLRLSGLTISGCWADSAIVISEKLTSPENSVGGSLMDQSAENNETVTVSESSSVYIRDCVFEDNRIEYDFGYHDGAAIRVADSDVEIRDSTFSSNYADGDGGALFAKNSNLTLYNTVFNANKASDDGGAINVYLTDMKIQNCTATENVSGDDGGAIYALYGRLHLSDSSILRNRASGGGGAVYALSTVAVKIRKSNISDNEAKRSGGGLYCFRTEHIAIVTSTLSSNTAESRGGGVFCNLVDSVNISNSVFSTNEAGRDGGALYCEARFSAHLTLFDRNRAGKRGGAIKTNHPVYLYSSKISNNLSGSYPAYYFRNSRIFNTVFRCNCFADGCPRDSSYDEQGRRTVSNESPSCPLT